MDIVRIIGVVLTEYPIYLVSSKYDYSRFWNKCIRINTLYTKILQATALHYSCGYFHFNDIPYEDSEIPVIEHVIPTKVIGSGMISIVFEGTDKEGNQVIIKTKRKGIDEKVIKGLQQIKNIIDWVYYLPYVYVFNIDYIFKHFEKNMLDQLSFEQEIKNHTLYKNNIAYNTTIIIPDIYHDYCTSTQIVMSKMEGVHYSVFSHDICTMYAKQLIQLCSKNLIIDGFIHSDLHAGNIIFNNDKIGIIDFGLMIQLSNKDRSNFFDILKYFANRNYEKTTTTIINEFIGPIETKQLLTHVQLEKLHQELCEQLHMIYDVNKSFNLKNIYTIIRIVNKYKLNINDCFYSLLIFMVSCECLIKEMAPSYINIFMEHIMVLTEMDE